MDDMIPVDVEADINYFPPATTTGDVIETKDWKPRLLGDADEYTRKMTIHDVRGIEDRFELDKNGFKFVKLPNKARDVSTDEKIQGEYYPEVAEVLKELTGATTVHIFNHCIRQCADPSQQGSLDAFGRWRVVPSGHPHVDYAGRTSDLRGTLEELQFPPSIAERFPSSLSFSSSSAASSSSSSNRFAFINAWRPLATIRRDPLTVADAATVPAEDYRIRAREFRRTGVRSGNYVLSHGDAVGHHHHHHHHHHQWYYMSEMREDEMVVFKGFDTKQDLPGWRCPHTSFVLEGTEALPPRESIEVRAVCFWD